MDIHEIRQLYLGEIPEELLGVGVDGGDKLVLEDSSSSELLRLILGPRAAEAECGDWLSFLA